MNFSITRGNPTEQERAAIESALAKINHTPSPRRSKWGQPQLRGELVKSKQQNRGNK